MSDLFDLSHVLIAIASAIVGAACGWAARWGSVRLAKLEGLVSGTKPWQVWGPPIAAALVFGAFGYELGATWSLLLHCVFGLVLVQVVFFDLEHRLILDRVIFPAMALALSVSIFNHPWWAGLATGLGAGLLFALIALIGALIFKAEAMGFGDVKLAVFIGLLLGWPNTVTGLFYGVFLAGVVSIGYVIWKRSMKGTIAYGPYLAVGALILLFEMR
ncbi:MAG TPA: A24 family peptidase [Candidatus Angelobacter sp.]|nr:A24 family peptidase [Candidatus Angelobacter sp.]